MLLRTIILGSFFLSSLMMQGQSLSLIGLDKEQVIQVVKKQHRKYSQDNSVVKQHFNYLKYVNGSETITWIIYFSDDDICKSTKKVCDYSEYDFILDELNEKCEETGDMIWEYSSDNQTYTFKLEEKDWYFTVREKVKSNKK